MRSHENHFCHPRALQSRNLEIFVFIAITDRNDLSVDHLIALDTLTVQNAFGVAAIATQTVNERTGTLIRFTARAMDRFDANDFGLPRRSVFDESLTLRVQEILTRGLSV